MHVGRYMDSTRDFWDEDALKLWGYQYDEDSDVIQEKKASLGKVTPEVVEVSMQGLVIV